MFYVDVIIYSCINKDAALGYHWWLVNIGSCDDLVLPGNSYYLNQCWQREILSLSAFLGTEDIWAHMVHISRVIITYTGIIIFPHIDNAQSTGYN